MRRVSGLPARGIVEALHAEILKGETPVDDMTLVAIKRRG